MKLFIQQQGDDATSMSEVVVDNLNIMIETGNFRYRITESQEGAILIRESSFGSLVIRPESANAVEIGSRI